MIIKKRDEPIYLFQLQALERRLSRGHPKMREVIQKVSRESSGLRGEQEIDYPLSFLNSDDYMILHDLRLKDDQGLFQIDSLIIHQNFILILEVKNWYGTILFGEHGQVIRINDLHEEEGFPSPISQVKLQQHRLKKYLHLDIPITFFIVFAFPSTILKGTSKVNIPKNVTYTNQLFFQIEDLHSHFEAAQISKEMLSSLANKIKEAHIQVERDVLTEFGVQKEELIQGVQCPDCQALMMRRGKWLCKQCGFQSENAHLQALNDYYLLIDSTVSNRTIRNYLQIDSPHIVKQLMMKAGYAYFGKTSARRYTLALK